jgi:hypothetical protein
MARCGLALLVTLSLSVVPLISHGDGSWGTGCMICDKPDQEWVCEYAEMGYRNCSSSPNGCANWEPLCDQEHEDDICSIFWPPQWCW